jgi:hypothetical protein
MPSQLEPSRKKAKRQKAVGAGSTALKEKSERAKIDEAESFY